MNIRLNHDQKSMLIEVKKLYKWKKELKFEELHTCVILKELSDNDAIDLRELCSEYLLKVGFDAEYTVNKKGKLLESLVDKLYIE